MNASLLAVGDLNGDGVPDAVVRNPDSDVYALLSSANGTWRDTRTTVFGVRSVALADITRDGLLDLVTGDFDGALRAAGTLPAGRGTPTATAMSTSTPRARCCATTAGRSRRPARSTPGRST